MFQLIIRPVFNEYSSGLNEAVYAPSFQLPTANTIANILNYVYKAVDSDLG